MLTRRLYYHLKPHIPRTARIAMRRWRAQKILESCGDVWPIKPGSEKPLHGWPGWPEGKQFALVLTHDVESQKGLDRVRKLAELEMDLGFRSSFNFIPEGPYRVPRELIDWLRENGFEIGVHDLKHDGKLYSSRKDFRRKAERINRYLEEWNAVGFRSGFMFNQLDWLHDLNILYDASTFDTDPFEPQPDGVDTIFPFWVPCPEVRSQLVRRSPEDVGGRAEVRSQRTEVRGQKSEVRDRQRELSSDLRPLTSGSPGSSGYVELPYTLPQDFTLFVLLRQQNINVWVNKLDWIADHRGMALLNVHPDYIQFDSAANGGGDYPLQLYADFLKYAAKRHQGRYLSATPSQVAAMLKADSRAHAEDASDPSAQLTTSRSGLMERRLNGKRAAVLLFSYYPSDPRPRRAAEAMVGAGMHVDLLCLRSTSTALRHECVAGVNVRRLRLRRMRGGKLRYFFEYGWFFLRGFLWLTLKALRRPYDIVHVHNMPDALVFASIVAKWRGAKIILDLHDPMPELLMSIYGLKSNARFVRLLRRLEEASIGFAHLALTPNIAFRNLFVSRSCDPSKMEIVMNSPQEQIFAPRPTRPEASKSPGSGDGEFRVMYHGSLVERHGLDVALRAFAVLRTDVPGMHFDIFGRRTPYMDRIESLIDQLGLGGLVTYHGQKSQDEIAAAIDRADLGVIPNKRSPFTELNMPTRIFEYLAMNKPVIAPDTPGIRDYFTDEELMFFHPDDDRDLARKMIWVFQHPVESARMVQRGREVYKTHRWSNEEQRFTQCVASLLGS